MVDQGCLFQPLVHPPDRTSIVSAEEEEGQMWRKRCVLTGDTQQYLILPVLLCPLNSSKSFIFVTVTEHDDWILVAPLNHTVQLNGIICCYVYQLIYSCLSFSLAFVCVSSRGFPQTHYTTQLATDVSLAPERCCTDAGQM